MVHFDTIVVLGPDVSSFSPFGPAKDIFCRCVGGFVFLCCPFHHIASDVRCRDTFNGILSKPRRSLIIRYGKYFPYNVLDASFFVRFLLSAFSPLFLLFLLVALAFALCAFVDLFELSATVFFFCTKQNGTGDDYGRFYFWKSFLFW